MFVVILRKSLSQISGLDWELWLGLFALNALSMLIQAGFLVEYGRFFFFTGKNGGGGEMDKSEVGGSTHRHTYFMHYFIPEAFSCFYIPIQHINVALTSVPSSL